MGDKANNILCSLDLTQDNQKKYSPVKDRFNNHLMKCQNIVFEHAKCNMCKQEEGELVDAFITDLYSLAVHCDHGTLHNKMIRHRSLAHVV